MSDVLDLLDRMGEDDLPAPPETLPREVHRRVNQMLIVQHLADFVFRATPVVMLQFAWAVLALAWFSVTGTYPRRNGNTDGDSRDTEARG